MDLPYLNPGSRTHPLEIARELRGNIAHWSQAGWMWGGVRPNPLAAVPGIVMFQGYGLGALVSMNVPISGARYIPFGN